LHRTRRARIFTGLGKAIAIFLGAFIAALVWIVRLMALRTAALVIPFSATAAKLALAGPGAHARVSVLAVLNPISALPIPDINPRAAIFAVNVPAEIRLDQRIRLRAGIMEIIEYLLTAPRAMRDIVFITQFGIEFFSATGAPAEGIPVGCYYFFHVVFLVFSDFGIQRQFSGQ